MVSVKVGIEWSTSRKQKFSNMCASTDLKVKIKNLTLQFRYLGPVIQSDINHRIQTKSNQTYDDLDFGHMR